MPIRDGMSSTFTVICIVNALLVAAIVFAVIFEV